MFNCKMIINRLHIEDARMEIGVAINSQSANPV